MDITKINIENIKPYPKNAKKHPQKQVDLVANSIKEFGFNQPIVIDKNNVIIVGHCRFLASKQLGLNEVPVLKVNLTEEQAKSYRLNDNKSNESDWDMELAIEDLKELDEKLQELTGFDKDLLIEPDEKDDEVPETPKEPKSKLGDLYELGGHRVLCGDSTKIEDVERLMDGKKADMVFTDPPYGVSYQSNMRTKTEKFDVIKNDDVIDGRAIELAYEYSTGWVLVCTGWTVLTEWLSIIDDKITNLIVWDKGGGGMGDLKRSLLTDYELIMAYNRGNEVVGKRLGSVWGIGKDFAGSYAHPTQKPVELPAQAIKTFSTGSVLDLFLGSGSTLIACEQTNRSCYGMELDPKYVDVIVQRYVDYTGNEEIKLNGKPITWKKSVKTVK